MAAVPALKVPGKHAVQLSVRPGTSEKDPGEQGMQLSLLAAPAEGRYRPAGHAVGDVAPWGQKDPGGQMLPLRVGSVLFVNGLK